jgi:hypothetical protein
MENEENKKSIIENIINHIGFYNKFIDFTNTSNKCYGNVYYKPLYLQLYDNTEKYKINIWNYL